LRTNVWTTGSGNLSTIGITNNSNLTFDNPNYTALVTNNAQVTALSGITFNAGAGTNTLSGSNVSIGAAGIVNNSAATQTVALGLTQSADSSVTAASGDLVISGSLDTAGYNLTLNGSSNTTVSGNISGNGAITKSGTGTTTLSGSNTAASTTLNGGSLNVTGSLHNSGNLAVGGSGSGNSLEIANGGVVSDAWGIIGYEEISSNNSVLVSGSGSRWNNNALWVGFYGSGGSLTISNGAAVYDSVGFIGGGPNASNNRVLVTGAGSLWDNAGPVDSQLLFVGQAGSGNTLTIADGGRVVNSLGAIGYDAASSNNSALVTGAGSRWNSSAALYVGYLGAQNGLAISNGGVATSSDGVIGGGGQANNNRALVTGEWLHWC
jgi:T5SS/PEP-CTERM-associated repeat protein/autotransporter-associated beta strand protein